MHILPIPRPAPPPADRQPDRHWPPAAGAAPAPDIAMANALPVSSLPYLPSRPQFRYSLVIPRPAQKGVSRPPRRPRHIFAQIIVSISVAATTQNLPRLKLQRIGRIALVMPMLPLRRLRRRL